MFVFFMFFLGLLLNPRVGKKSVSRLTREFSQTAELKDAQPCQDVISCHCLVPGMSQYGESQDFSEFSEFSEVGTTTKNKGGAAPSAESSQSFDRNQESTNSNRNFSPTSK